MPTYDYACATCGDFDALRTLHQRNEPANCPACGAASSRVFVHAPQLALMASEKRHAIGINEQARHEPKSSGSYARLRHVPGCACCAPNKRSATAIGANGNKAFPRKRPWMISH